MTEKTLFGGIEGGGTKFNCIVVSDTEQPSQAVETIAETRIPTTTPEETLSAVSAFFTPYLGQLQSIGLACFGPIDLHPASPTYGYMTTTPKPGWAHTDLLTPLTDALSLPIALDTDVNGAALGEHLWGAAQDVDTFIYLTIGTGIGGGIMHGGKLLHGQTHPELGHIPMHHDPYVDTFPGICPYHRDCFEGLACGPAIQARWGKPAEELPPEHPAWKLEADYIGAALSSYILTLSPQRIILGGGVMQTHWLFPLVRQAVQTTLNDYIAHPNLGQQIDSYIVPPGLGGHAGVLGAVGLAKTATFPKS